MTDFTSGEWRVEEFPYRHIRSDSGCVWADDYKPDANARLIAAAPDLYAALEIAQTYLHPEYLAISAKISAVLAKARGETA